MRRYSKYIKRAISLVLTLAFMLALTPAASAAGYKAIVSASSMKVYSDANLARRIGELPKNTVFSVKAEKGGVAYISYKGRTGFANTAELSSIKNASEPTTFIVNSRIYASPSLSSKYVSVKAGYNVNLVATSGKWAMIELSGNIGYTYAAHLGDKSEIKEPEKPPADNGVKYEEFTAVITASSLKCYKKASATSKNYMGALKKGTHVTVHAYNDKWAYIDYNKKYAFCLRSGLAKYVEPQETPKPVETPKPTEPPKQQNNSDYFNGNYSNEEIIYIFLMKELGFNSAAACGVLANIKAESGFRVTALNTNGGSYGLCQWTGGRKTKLQNYCKSNGYGYDTIEGQLRYLKYELENSYKKTLSYMLSVENSAQGAYDAGYYYCYNFEVPANRASVSVKRGNIAKDTYWTKYN